VKTCVIIHTLISFIEDGDEDGEFITELVREGTDTSGDVIQQVDSEPSDTQWERQGQRKCAELKRMLFKGLYV
jgi:hypothetical protein